MNLDNIANKYESEGTSQTSDFYRIKEGQNKMRILTDFVMVESIYKGVFPNSKYMGMKTPGRVIAADEKVTSQAWAWAVIRGEKPEQDELKIVQFGKTLINNLIQYRKNPEYEFDKFPMQFDITVNSLGDGPNRYTMIASPKRSEVTQGEMEKLNKKKSINDIIASILAKQTGASTPAASTEPIAYPENNVKADDMFGDSVPGGDVVAEEVQAF